MGFSVVKAPFSQQVNSFLEATYMHLGGARQRTTHPALKSQRLGHGILEYQRRRYDLVGGNSNIICLFFSLIYLGKMNMNPF